MTAAASNPMPCTPPRVQNGTYTVSGPRGHYTLKVHTAQKAGLKGQRIISLLVGPDNTTHYRGVAFWHDADGFVQVWTKHRSWAHKYPRINGRTWSKTWNKTEKRLAMWADLALRGDKGFWSSHDYGLMLEGRCVRCNRPLTDPKSIELGIGPKCRGER